MSTETSPTLIPRFAVPVGEYQLLIPGNMASEFLPSAQVFPVPRAPAGLLGMLHLRGQAVPVICADLSHENLPVKSEYAVLVMRTGLLAVALVCAGPPVQTSAEIHETNGRSLGDAPWLSAEWSDADDAHASYQTFDLDKLIETCLSPSAQIPANRKGSESQGEPT